MAAAGARLLVLGLLAPLAAWAQPKVEVNRPVPLNAAEAESEGRALVAGLLAQKPAENATNTGILSVRQDRSAPQRIRVRFEIFSTPTNWVSIYRTGMSTDAPASILTIVHSDSGPNHYLLEQSATPGASNAVARSLTGDAAMIPFAGSDFWAFDLGLEFLRWPQQRLLRRETRRSRACSVLESANPAPAGGGYSRIVSWIDNETGGILHADAYNSANEVMKVFDPKGVKKVQGRYELEGMELRNVLKNSQSTIEFDLPANR